MSTSCKQYPQFHIELLEEFSKLPLNDFIARKDEYDAYYKAFLTSYVYRMQQEEVSPEEQAVLDTLGAIAASYEELSMKVSFTEGLNWYEKHINSLTSMETSDINPDSLKELEGQVQRSMNALYALDQKIQSLKDRCNIEKAA